MNRRGFLKRLATGLATGVAAWFGLRPKPKQTSGYVWAPYIPYYVTPPELDLKDLETRKGLHTRYGKKMVREDFYGTVVAADLTKKPDFKKQSSPSLSKVR